jgi:IS30 family transposase
VEKRVQRWRLPAEVVRKLHRLIAEGYTDREILAMTGVGKGSIWRARNPEVRVAPVEWRPRAGRLQLEDRIEIAVGLGRGDTFTAIAAGLGFDVSTVSREVGGRAGRDCYKPQAAHRRARVAARRPKPSKLEGCARLQAQVVAGLEVWWSPQQIEAKLRSEFPSSPEMWVSHETIYKSLYVQGRGALRKELTGCLRSGRARRRASNSNRWVPPTDHLVPISERPAEVEDRAVPGHWEGDLIYGRNTRDAIGTLVERTTRYLMLLHLPDGHSAEHVRVAMAAKIEELPASMFKTLTWDRGPEMRQPSKFTVETGVDVYFCDPHKPWQRGSNENTNGLLRQYFPKGSDISGVTAEDLDAAADSLNGRPRKTLDWDTPAEALAKVLALTP